MIPKKNDVGNFFVLLRFFFYLQKRYNININQNNNYEKHP